jgi:hypothetical protein
MPERLITVGRLGDLIERANEFVEPADAIYSLYVPENRVSSLDENVECGYTLFLDDDPDDFVPDEAKERDWVLYSDLRLIQNVLDVAHMVHTHPTQRYLVKALEYFMHNDAFIE